MEIIAIFGNKKDAIPASSTGFFSPTASLAMHASSLGAKRLHLLVQKEKNVKDVGKIVSTIEAIAPDLDVNLVELEPHDPFDPKETWKAILPFVNELPSDREYLFSLATGTHIHIYVFAKLVESSFLNARAVQAKTGGKSDQVDATKLGALSGSIAFSRPDEGSNYIGVPLSTGYAAGHLPLGVFINSANGNSFENTPGTASGKGPYVSSQGTYGNSLFETYDDAVSTPIVYAVGDQLVASVNGYLCPSSIGTAAAKWLNGVTLGDGGTDLVIGIVKMPADSVQGELVYDQRI